MACPPPTTVTLAYNLQRTGACHPTPHQLVPASCDNQFAAHTFGHSLPARAFHVTFISTALVPACLPPARAAPHHGA